MKKQILFITLLLVIAYNMSAKASERGSDSNLFTSSIMNGPSDKTKKMQGMKWHDTTKTLEIKLEWKKNVVVTESANPSVIVSSLALPSPKDVGGPLADYNEQSLFFENDLLMHVILWKKDSLRYKRYVSFFKLINGKFEAVKNHDPSLGLGNYDSSLDEKLLSHSVIYVINQNVAPIYPYKTRTNELRFTYDSATNSIIRDTRRTFLSRNDSEVLPSWVSQYQLEEISEAVEKIAEQAYQYPIKPDFVGFLEGITISRRFFAYNSKNQIRIFDVKTGAIKTLTPKQVTLFQNVFRTKYWAPIQDNWILYTAVGDEKTDRAYLCHLNFELEDFCENVQQVKTKYYYPWDRKIDGGYLNIP